MVATPLSFYADKIIIQLQIVKGHGKHLFYNREESSITMIAAFVVRAQLWPTVANGLFGSNNPKLSVKRLLIGIISSNKQIASPWFLYSSMGRVRLVRGQPWSVTRAQVATLWSRVEFLPCACVRSYRIYNMKGFFFTENAQVNQ